MRDSIVLFDTASARGAVVDRAIVDKEVVIGAERVHRLRRRHDAQRDASRAASTPASRSSASAPSAGRRRGSAATAGSTRTSTPDDFETLADLRAARRHAPPTPSSGLRVLHVAAEASPYAKVGGLARRRRCAADGASRARRRRAARAAPLTAAPTCAVPVTGEPADSGAHRCGRRGHARHARRGPPARRAALSTGRDLRRRRRRRPLRAVCEAVLFSRSRRPATPKSSTRMTGTAALRARMPAPHSPARPS